MQRERNVNTWIFLKLLPKVLLKNHYELGKNVKLDTVAKIAIHIRGWKRDLGVSKYTCFYPLFRQF